MEYQSKKNRAEKFRNDKLFDKEGITPRLSDLIKWTRYGVYLLLVIAFMLSLGFLRDAWQVVVSLFF